MFQTDKPQQDRAYNEMLLPIREALSSRIITELAELSGGYAAEDGRRLQIDTLGKTVSVGIPEGDTAPALESWHALVLLHYIVNADGVKPFGEWMSFGEMKDGLIRGTKYAMTSDRWFRQFLKGKAPEEIGKACALLGGVPAEGRGDVNILLPFLPNFPVLLSLWEADEDFDAAGKLLIDRNADHYLSIEDGVTVGEIVQKHVENAFARYTEK